MSSRSYSLHLVAVTPQAGTPVLGGRQPPCLRAFRKRDYTLTPELPESAMSSLFFLSYPLAATPPTCATRRAPAIGERNG